MNKYEEYQEALTMLATAIKVSYTIDGQKVPDCIIKNTELLQELVVQTKVPTLEEVKREWEALGYKCKERTYYIYFYNGEFSFAFFYKTNEEDIDAVEIENHSEEPLVIEGKLLKLINKTRKALGWM